MRITKNTKSQITSIKIKLANYITESGRTPMFWSDVISQEPEVYHLLPKNLICLHWDYASNVSSERLTRLANSGAEHLYTLAVYGLWVFINLWNGRRPNRKIHRR